MVLRLGILISGRGSNMESILRAIDGGEIQAEPRVVVSNNPDAPGLGIARELGVKTAVIPSRGFGGSRDQYDRMIADALFMHGVMPEDGLVCLAGFMRKIGDEFVGMYKNRILNIHPSLLPAFQGLAAQRQALEYGVWYSGCTVHFVDTGIDTGPIIMQALVPVKDGDTEESLSARILKEEHRIYPRVVDLFARDKIVLHNRSVTILD